MSYLEYTCRRVCGWVHAQYAIYRVRWRCWQIERLLRRAEKLLGE